MKNCFEATVAVVVDVVVVVVADKDVGHEVLGVDVVAVVVDKNVVSGVVVVVAENVVLGVVAVDKDVADRLAVGAPVVVERDVVVLDLDADKAVVDVAVVERLVAAVVRQPVLDPE